MHPILLHIGPITIYTYGFCAALALLIAMGFLHYQAGKMELPRDPLMNLFFYSVIAGIVGSRIFYVLLYLPMYLENPLEIFMLWKGGLVFYGGFLCGLAFALIYIKKQKLPAGKVFDIVAVGAPLAHSIARIGCFFAGCCYGKPSNLPWAVTFNHPETLAHPTGVCLHPTQLYNSLGNFTIFLILFLLSRSGRFPGKLFFIYLLIYGLFRSFIEIFRADRRGAPLFDFLSTSQTIGLAAAAFSAICLIFFAVRDRREKR